MEDAQAQQDRAGKHSRRQKRRRGDTALNVTAIATIPRWRPVSNVTPTCYAMPI